MHRNYFLTCWVQTDDLEDRCGNYHQMSAGNYHISVRQVYETEAKLRVQIYLQLIMRSNKVGNILISQNEIYVNDSM